jgi:hypothetical protein
MSDPVEKAEDVVVLVLLLAIVAALLFGGKALMDFFKPKPKSPATPGSVQINGTPLEDGDVWEYIKAGWRSIFGGLSIDVAPPNVNASQSATPDYPEVIAAAKKFIKDSADKTGIFNPDAAGASNEFANDPGIADFIKNLKRTV